MDKNTDKKLAFEYFVYQLHVWYKEACGDTKDNDLSILKVLKLLFFVSAVGTDKNSQSSLIDDVFDNFCAMPYGHVESDIYTIIKEKRLDNISIDTTKSRINSLDPILQNIDNGVKVKIDKSIDLLKEINFNLIKFSSFELVELSHRWYSWQKNYTKAKLSGSFSIPISIDEIKREIKIYQL
ncbi:type II toxin-antitoxin system antitoxin SocA domain-containing protein [Elizabethkingia anophelis]|uniref:type II toxin-antitoxin system antitoxin SocA domain-containing protein n=1 Tax=Elizabethkingia anophelis TaxID=1117645 RepID=UPI003892BBA3